MTTATRTFVPARFGIDADPLFDGVHDPSVRWNGFACPYFPHAEVEKIKAWLDAQASDHPEDADTLAFDPARGWVLHSASYENEPGYEDEVIAAVMIDGQPFYPVGAWGWTWEEWTAEALADLAERNAQPATCSDCGVESTVGDMAVWKPNAEASARIAAGTMKPWDLVMPDDYLPKCRGCFYKSVEQ